MFANLPSGLIFKLQFDPIMVDLGTQGNQYPELDPTELVSVVK